MADQRYINPEAIRPKYDAPIGPGLAGIYRSRDRAHYEDMMSPQNMEGQISANKSLEDLIQGAPVRSAERSAKIQQLPWETAIKRNTAEEGQLKNDKTRATFNTDVDVTNQGNIAKAGDQRLMQLEQSITIAQSIANLGQMPGAVMISELQRMNLPKDLELTLPELSVIGVNIGWVAEGSKIESNWEAMSWELYIDDYQIALDQFGWEDISFFDSTTEAIYRTWNVILRNLSAGRHTVRYLVSQEISIDDGWSTSPPGKYEYIAYLTMIEKPVYPTVSSVANPGQHAYTSQKAKLDFLLYLPETYGKDPETKWPLIIYLHDAEWRGTPPEILRGEFNPLYMSGDFFIQLKFFCMNVIGTLLLNCLKNSPFIVSQNNIVFVILILRIKTNLI